MVAILTAMGTTPLTGSPSSFISAATADGARIFRYGEQETAYLAARDVRLAAVMAAVGHIEREIDPDLLSSVIHHIIGQQISTAAQQTIWRRMHDALGEIDADVIAATPVEELQSFGMTFRKAGYIRDLARQLVDGSFDLEGIRSLDDADAVERLVAIKGVGVWTAEMILLFCLERPDVLSYGDLGIQRGLRMLYHHRAISPALFKRYRRRFSPCGSVASLYLWAVAGGAVPGLRDRAPRRSRSRTSKPTGQE